MSTLSPSNVAQEAKLKMSLETLNLYHFSKFKVFTREPTFGGKLDSYVNERNTEIRYTKSGKPYEASL